MLNAYGPQGQRLDDGTSTPEVINTAICSHPNLIEVEDNSGIEGVTAYQCQICGLGWLVKQKLTESKNERSPRTRSAKRTRRTKR